MFNRTFNTQILYLFLCNFLIYIVGMGLIPLLPLYAARFGASQPFVGIYFAITYLANAMGHLLTGWVAGRFPRRALFISAAALGVPALLLLGQATSLLQVVALTAILWFCGGMDASLIGIFTGLQADGKSRGKSFSLMSVAVPLGALAGGTITGYLVAWQGYRMMCTGLAGLWAILPLVGIFGLNVKAGAHPGTTASKNSGAGQSLGKSFYWVLAFSFISAAAVNIILLGRPFSMQKLDFSPQAVASTATVSGLVTIPVVLLNGALSDRLGRAQFLFLTYGLSMGGSLTLAAAQHLWQFWITAILTLVASTTSGAMTYTLVTDRLAPEKLNRAFAFLNGASATAGVFSFSMIGLLMERFGQHRLFLITGLLPVLAAIFLVLFLRDGRESPPTLLGAKTRLSLLLKRRKSSTQVSQRASAKLL